MRRINRRTGFGNKRDIARSNFGAKIIEPIIVDRTGSKKDTFFKASSCMSKNVY
jgi:hypothetical protein